MNKKVTICVLYHNGLLMTSDFIDNLYGNCDSSLFNLVLIDNGSSEEFSNTVIDKIKNKNIFYYRSPENTGVIKGRNIGFSLCENINSEYIMFLDNDQMPLKFFVEDHIKKAEDGNFDIFGVEAWIMNKSYFPIRKANKNEKFSYVGAGGMMIKKEVALKIGKFDTIFSPAYFEDPDYNFRCFEQGLNIGFDIDSKINHIGHQTLGVLPNRSASFSMSFINFKNKWKNPPPLVFLAQ